MFNAAARYSQTAPDEVMFVRLPAPRRSVQFRSQLVRSSDEVVLCFLHACRLGRSNMHPFRIVPGCLANSPYACNCSTTLYIDTMTMLIIISSTLKEPILCDSVALLVFLTAPSHWRVCRATFYFSCRSLIFVLSIASFYVCC